MSVKEQAKWEIETTIPNTANSVNAVSIGNRILWIMGNGGGNKDILSYDTETKILTKETKLPTSLVLPGTVAVDKKLYIFGGSESSSLAMLNKVQIYDTETKIWTEGAPMPTARGYITPIAVGRKIYVVGGYTGVYGQVSSYLDVFEVYDIDSNAWEIKENYSKKMISVAAISIGDNLYYFGGEVAPSVFAKTTWAYNIKTDTWVQKADAPMDGLSSAVRIGNSIYVTGSGTAGPANRRVFIYDINNDTWTEGATLLSGKMNPAMVLVNDKIYISDFKGGTVESLCIDIPNQDQLCVLLKKEKTFQLGISNHLADNVLFNWKSDKEEVAMVDKQGVVTGINAGDCNITVESRDNSYQSSIPVRVLDALVPDPLLAVHLEVGDTENLIITQNFSDNVSYEWSSDNEAVATVDEYGIVTATGEGICNISATDTNGALDNSIPVRVVSKNIQS